MPVNKFALKFSPWCVTFDVTHCKTRTQESRHLPAYSTSTHITEFAPQKGAEYERVHPGSVFVSPPIGAEVYKYLLTTAESLDPGTEYKSHTRPTEDKSQMLEGVTGFFFLSCVKEDLVSFRSSCSWILFPRVLQLTGC